MFLLTTVCFTKFNFYLITQWSYKIYIATDFFDSSFYSTIIFQNTYFTDLKKTNTKTVNHCLCISQWTNGKHSSTSDRNLRNTMTRIYVVTLKSSIIKNYDR